MSKVREKCGSAALTRAIPKNVKMDRPHFIDEWRLSIKQSETIRKAGRL